MKRLTWTVIVLGFFGIFTTLLTRYFLGVEKDIIYIALAGPMSGSDQEEGAAMHRGAIMAYEQIRKEGILLKGKDVKIIPYDDRNIKDAAQIAIDIANEGKVLLVLGHYSSSSSKAAGPIYQRKGIPAITASAAVDNVTENNDWFFRTIPTNHTMTEFVIQSMRQSLGITSTPASMIYDTQFYNSTAEIFKEQAENIFDNLNIWSFDSRSDKKENDLNKIIAEIRAKESDSIGPIFFATGSRDCAYLMSGFRYPGTNYPIIGFSSLSSPTFIEQLNDSSEQKENTGYYTNGTYAVSPFISYLADQPNARSFREKFVRTFDREPLRWAATYYDAMLVALHAVEQAEVQGENIQLDRRRVKEALNSINRKDVAVNGVTGDIYFDEDGNVVEPSLTLGVWQNNEFIPAYQQYKLSVPADLNTDFLEGDGKRENKKQGKENIGDSKKTPLKAVYTGVDINAIYNLDLNNGSFTADFYLWFRFKGTFDDTAVKFINAVAPVTLEKLIVENVDKDVITRTYRVVANFTIESDVDIYPLDRHTLPIRFYHTGATRASMIYIPDVVGMPGSIGKKNRGEALLEKLSGWEIEKIVSKQNIRTQEILGENKTSYSEIDTEISIRREERGNLLIKMLIPYALIIACCYLLFCLPLEKLQLRMYCLLLFLLVTTGIHILYEHTLPGWELTHYMLYFVVTLIVFSALIFGGTYWAHQRNYVRAAQGILYKGAFFYLAAVSAGGGVLFYVYLLHPNVGLMNLMTSLFT